MGGLPTDKFCGWTYGAHALSKDELTLDFDDATMAAAALGHTISMNLAVWIRHAFQDVVPDARDNPDWNICSAFEISRLIRNAFSHNPADPHWSIDPLCRNQVFIVDNVITLDTNDIDGTRFDWHHYGGPLALYRLSQWVRANLLTPQMSEP
ncbi:hypothetical protein RMSM_01520 [Rhodopirellula maiorica SM1]|uniref:Uncharacterized protein n=2 Tax=Novipirellula TaxID=2795426 RepID=M5RQI3_9BACT|nr:hypothetical protein RMSM_01520 [Rhodopirellula maiorica SM1]